jgi:membrane-associated phospholipid phosphatase
MISLGKISAAHDNSPPMNALATTTEDASWPPANSALANRRQSLAFSLLLGGFAFALLAALALPFDRSIALWFAQHRLPGEFARLMRVSEVFGWGGGVAVIILTAVRLDSRGWRILPALIVPSLGAGLVADTIKLFIARTRPHATEEAATTFETFVASFPAFRSEAIAGGYGHHVQSFPSGHSATAVGLAIALSVLYPRGRWLFPAFAALAMLQRLDADAHYLSDVLAGGAVACLVSAICSYFSPSLIAGTKLGSGNATVG